MGKKMFARGYEVSREEKKKQDEQRSKAKNQLWRFFVSGDGEEADLRFLTEEPVNFYEHTLKVGDHYENYTCTGEDCSLCADGEKATYKGAYLVVDRREFEYKDKDGNKKKGKDQVRLFVQGMRVVSQLDRIHEKYGLSNRDVTIVRLGKGTSTTYTIERGEKEELTKEEIKALLPENLRDKYNGTEDSLMTIVEEQLLMAVKDYEPTEEDEEEVEETISGRDKLIGIDEEEPPKKLGKKSKFKKPQNSVKPKAKDLFINK